MLVTMCKSKIHRVVVTDANLRYEGSVTVDEDLLEAADLLPGEKVHVVNLNNGARLETYTMPGPRKSGVVCMNGAAARLAAVGDQIILIAYALMDAGMARSYVPKVVYVDGQNRLLRAERKR